MLSLDERIAATKEKMNRLEREKRDKERRERDKMEKINSRLRRIVGELFLNNFPIALELTPHRTKGENAVEFAPLNDLFATLAADKDWTNLLTTALCHNKSPVSTRK